MAAFIAETELPTDLVSGAPYLLNNQFFLAERAQAQRPIPEKSCVKQWAILVRPSALFCCKFQKIEALLSISLPWSAYRKQGVRRESIVLSSVSQVN